MDNKITTNNDPLGAILGGILSNTQVGVNQNGQIEVPNCITFWERNFLSLFRSCSFLHLLSGFSLKMI